MTKPFDYIEYLNKFPGKYANKYIHKCIELGQSVHIHTAIYLQHLSELELRVEQSDNKERELKQIFMECKTRNEHSQLDYLLTNIYKQYKEAVDKLKVLL